MSNNIMIRTAKKDYVCDKCEHIIKKGTEYLDKIILNHGTCVQHNRYHDECPATDISNLVNRLINEGPIPVATNDVKYWLTGIEYDNTGMVCVVQSWDKLDTIYVSIDTFMKEYTYD